jgi:hypothetical protein
MSQDFNDHTELQQEEDSSALRASLCSCLWDEGYFLPCCEEHEREYVEFLEEQAKRPNFKHPYYEERAEKR